MSKFTKCLIDHGNKSMSRIPQHVKDALTSDNKSHVIATMEQYIATLESTQQLVEEQHSEQVAAVKAEAINSTVAQDYLSNPDDIYNELNSFGLKSFKKFVKNTVMQLGSFKEAFAKNKTLDDKERESVQHFIQAFHRDAITAMESIFKYKEGSSHFKGRQEDPMQYLPKRVKAPKKHKTDKDVWILQETELSTPSGQKVLRKLDPVLASAVSSVAYEWLAGDSLRSAEGQTASSVRQLLGLEKGAALPGSAAELMELGADSNKLARELGRTILDRLALSSNAEADVMSQPRMEMSLGFFALATMEEMNLIKRQKFYTGELSDAAIENGTVGPEFTNHEFGLSGLKKGLQLTGNQIWVGNADPTGKATRKAFRVSKSSEHEGFIKKARELRTGAPDAFAKLFGQEEAFERRSWVKKLLPRKMRLKRTNTEVSAKQKRNLQKYSDQAWKMSTPVMQPFHRLMQLGHGKGKDPRMAKAFDRIVGKLDPEDKTKLLLRDKMIEGTNRGIDNEMDAIDNFLTGAMERQKDNKGTSFFLPNYFIVNMRMQQEGDINPQNSKRHRSLFAPEGWEQSFDPKEESDMEENFKLAVAFAFDIETGKVGGVNPALRALDKLVKPGVKRDSKAELQHEQIMAAIEILQQLDRKPDMQLDADMVETIATAVEGLETNVHAFRGLMEWARYQNYIADNKGKHKKNRKKFTTDIHGEIDGVSNGVILGILQLIPDSANKQATLAALAMGGASVDPKALEGAGIDLDTLTTSGNKYLHDAYQRMGKQWAISLSQMRTKFASDKYGANKLKWMDHLELLLGDFTDDKGVISSVLRSLAKPRTMQTIYGAGNTTQTRILNDENVINDGIYGGIEKILSTPDSQLSPKQKAIEFRKIMNAVDALSRDFPVNNKFPKTKARPINSERYFKGDVLNIEQVRKFSLDDRHVANIKWRVERTYGQAMKSAITTTYGDLIEARKPLMTSVSLVAVVYNNVLSRKIEAAKAAYKSEHNKHLTITKTVMDQILKEMDYLFPKIETALHTDRHPSYLPLATAGRAKNKADRKNAITSTVSQSYNSDLSQQEGYTDSIGLLDPPGPGAVVKTIQSMEALIANAIMGVEIGGVHVDTLNNHDGFSHSIRHGHEIGQAANEEMYRIMSNWSIGEQFNKMYQDKSAHFEEALQDLDENGWDNIIQDMINQKLINIDMMGAALGIDTSPEKSELNDLIDSGVDYWEASKQVVNKMRSESPLTDKELFGFIEKDTGDRLEDISAQMTSNKDTFMGAVTELANYPFKGKGFKPEGYQAIADGKLIFTPQSSTETSQTVDVDSVLTVDARITKAEQRLLATLGSSESTVSHDPKDYDPVTGLDNMNVEQVFDQLVHEDDQDMFTGVHDSSDHVTHLKRIMNRLVKDVMKPIDLYMGDNNDESKGEILTSDEKNDSIWIQKQKRSTNPQPGLLTHGLRLSNAEILTHELLHHVTHLGLKNNVHLRKQAQVLWELAHKMFTDKYGDEAYRVFLNNPSDPAPDAHEVQAAKDRFNHVFNPKQRADGTTAGYHEFIVFGLSNENFRNELATLSIPDGTVRVKKALFGIIEKNIQQTLLNLYNSIMEFVNQTILRQKHSTKMDQEIENLALAVINTENRSKSALFKKLVAAELKATALAGTVDKKVKKVVNKAWNSTAIGYTISNLKKLPELDNMLSHQMRLAMLWYSRKDGNFLSSLITEAKSATESRQGLHDLGNRRNRVLDAAKLDVSSNMKKAVNSWFDRELKAHEKTAATKVLLKADVSSLLDQHPIGWLKNVITDVRSREQAIRAVMAQVDSNPALRAHREFFLNASDDLGYFMIHSALRSKQDVPFMNAHNIARMTGSKFADTLQGQDFTDAVALIDKLSTLSALRYTNPGQASIVGDLINENADSIQNLMVHHNLLKEQAQKELFDSKPALMQKGYIKTILNDRIKYEQGMASDEEHWDKSGYIMQDKALPRDPDDPVKDDIRMFKAVLGTVNNYQSGILSITQKSGRGQTQYDIQKQLKAGQAAAKNAKANDLAMQRVLFAKIANMHNARTSPPKPDGYNYMVPKFNGDGTIVSLRYMMAESTKDLVLEQFSEVDSVLAAMSAQIVDKRETPQINNELISELKSIYDKEFAEFPEGFVEISPYATDERYREIWDMMPREARAAVKDKFGDNRLLVPQNVVDAAFGQRKHSMIELFGKDKKDMKLMQRSIVEVINFALGFHNPFVSHDQPESRQGRAITRVKRIEETLTQLASLGKTNIVVRNVNVTYGNHLSNMAYLKSKGIGLEFIRSQATIAINGAVEYGTNKKELDQLTAQRDVHKRKLAISYLSTTEKNALKKEVAKLNRKIRNLNDLIARNPTSKLIEAGLMPNMVDDVDTAQIQSPHSFGVDKFLDEQILGRLPGKAEQAARHLFMTQDTHGYKVVNNAVKMTDYIGRYILYQHYTENGLKHQEAFGKVMDEFINFDLPTHRMIEYANNIGGVLFSKYQIRVLKQIGNLIVNKPFTTLSTYILGKFIGDNNILNSIPGFTKDAASMFAQPVGTVASSAGQIFNVDMTGTLANAVVE